MTFKRPNIGQIFCLDLEFVELGVFLQQFLLEVIDVLVHANDLVLNTIWRLSDDLVNVDLRPDAFRLACEVKSLQRFLHVGRQLRNAADHSSLRLATERVLQDPGQLTIAEVDVVVVLRAHLLALGQLVDYLREGKQRLVDVCALSEAQALTLGLAGAF